MFTSDSPVIWEPHPGSQYLFLTCPYDELLYHGTRGPGKTDALIMDFAQHCGLGFGAYWRGILFRETYPQLADVIAKTKKWFPQIFPGIKFNESDKTWTWPDGEQLLLRHMQRPEDYWNYHGHEYPWIGWEELTNWATPDCYHSMFACNRSSAPFSNMPRKVRATCNPWGSGHRWVKAHFIDAAPAGEPVETVFENPMTGEPLRRTRTHLFGVVFENEHLMATDPMYVANLMAIKDENKRAAWLEGSWDISAGGFFSDLWSPSRHVIQRPWTPPKHWECYTSFDWGSASPFSLGMWCVSDGTEAPDGKIYPRGALIRFDEWYGAKDTQNVGLRLTNEALGKGIASRLQAYISRGLHFQTGPADPSIWKEDGGPSIYEQILSGARQSGYNSQLWERADNQRATGWQQMRSRLEGEEDRGPLLYVMANCKAWLRTVPVLPRDERNWDDVDTDAEDHAADETRYACMWKRRSAATVKLIGA